MTGIRTAPNMQVRPQPGAEQATLATATERSDGGAESSPQPQRPHQTNNLSHGRRAERRR